eukprot:3337163-Amphidinium_carterae.1
MEFLIESLALLGLGVEWWATQAYKTRSLNLHVIGVNTSLESLQQRAYFRYLQRPNCVDACSSSIACQMLIASLHR